MKLLHIQINYKSTSKPETVEFLDFEMLATKMDHCTHGTQDQKAESLGYRGE